MMFVFSSWSSLGRLTNSTCMWMPFCCLFIKLFKSQMSFSCLTDTSPTVPRTSQRSRVHKLTPEMPASAKQVILTNAKNKIQLNAMLVEGLLNPDYYTIATQKHTLTIAGVSDVPVEIVGGVRIDRHDLCSIHEEADIVITQHAVPCSLL